MSIDHPTRVPCESPAVWRSGDLTNREWSIELTDGERDVIAEAARRALHAGLRPGGLTREQFPLREMQDAISSWSSELSDGRGFVLLRRFPNPEAQFESPDYGASFILRGLNSLRMKTS